MKKKYNEIHGSYREDLILNGYYIDAHCPRPYDHYKNEIDKLVELIYKIK